MQIEVTRGLAKVSLVVLLLVIVAGAAKAQTLQTKVTAKHTVCF